MAALPFTALGGLTSAPPGPAVTSSPTTSMLVPTHPEKSESYATASLFASAPATGGEYSLSPPWALHTSTAGREAAVRLASSLVDAANTYVGMHGLPAQIRRRLIQLVLLGIGGLGFVRQFRDLGSGICSVHTNEATPRSRASPRALIGRIDRAW